MISSGSPLAKKPAERRFSTSSRMELSLDTAARAADIESRTTKSDMRMIEFSSLLAGLIRGRRAGHVAHRRRAAVVLDLFLVFSQLLFQLVQHQLDGREDVLVLGAGHEAVFMLGRDDEFHHFLVLLVELQVD